MEVKELSYEDWMKIKGERKLTAEEHKKWRQVYVKRWRLENPEKIKNYTKDWRAKNPEKVKDSSKAYYATHKQQKKEWEIKYYQENKSWIGPRNKIYNDKHKEELDRYYREYYMYYVIQAFRVLGGCKCAICGDTDLSHLTIDHIDSNGAEDRRNTKLYTNHLYKAIVDNKLSTEQIQNLRVLCWNHNSSRTRGYLDLPPEQQSKSQKRRSQLWKEALDFFGPCKTCKTDKLKFLTVSHIHNNGAELRKQGQPCGADLLSRFRVSGWPESLKEDYCLECWNCNSSRIKVRLKCSYANLPIKLRREPWIKGRSVL